MCSKVYPLDNLAAIDPIKSVLKRIEAISANFLWCEGEQGCKYHGVAWKKCCGPVSEGGIGIRSMHDINQALAMKLWWQLRTSNFLWASFMRNKYAQKFHITDYKIKVGISGTWCRMLKVKEQTEKYMKWIIGKGETGFWKERWWGDGK